MKKLCIVLFILFIFIFSINIDAAIKIGVNSYVYTKEQTEFTIGFEYEKIKNIPLISEFKKTEFDKVALVDYKKYITCKCGDNSIYSDNEIPNVAYSLYNLGNVNMPYESTTIGWLNAGGTHTMIFQKEQTTTYQNKISETFNSSFGLSLQAKYPLEALTLIGKIDANIAKSIGSESSFSTTYSSIVGHQYTEPILESGYYLQQKRGVFEAYFLEVYKINYNVDVSSSWHWFHTDTHYKIDENKIKSYTLTDIKILYKFKTDLGSMLTLYTLDEINKLCYAGPMQNENTTLYI